VTEKVAWWLCTIAISAVSAHTSLAAEVKLALTREAEFVGAVGCKSSSCHGGAGEKRNQYATWLQQDFHARSFAVLTAARSARIAETLALPAAHTSSRCTVCHSPFQSVAPARLGLAAHPDEGVSCENCHGAAQSWLRGHTRKDWTYTTRRAAGMRDLRSFYVRANTCVACHQNIESDILRAGHPELMFELDGQSVSEPKHWRDDDPATGVRSWLVGQAVALREMSWDLSKHETPVSEAAFAQWKGLAWLLAKATAQQSHLPAIQSPTGTTSHAFFASVQAQADLLGQRAADARLSDDFARALLQILTVADSDFSVSKDAPPEILFRRAQRLVLALDRLSDAIAHQPTREIKNPELARLFEDVRSQADFQPARFAEHLVNFRATIGQTTR
jgi:hypothetical protein